VLLPENFISELLAVDGRAACALFDAALVSEAPKQ
jgi:hypothetical protein